MMIAVLTPGAVGGLLAALLHRSGVDVTLVARPHRIAQLRERGLVVRSARYGHLTCRPPVVTSPPSGSDVLLTVKAYGLPDVLPALAEARPGEVVSLLNGLDHVPLLRARTGTTNVAGASVSVEVLRQQAGEELVIEHRSQFLAVTVPAHAAEWRATTALREAGVDVTVGGTEEQVLWTKLRMLAPLALLTSYHQAPLGEAREREPALTEQLLAEVAALATASGVPTDPERLSSTLHGVHGSMRSSLQHDMAAAGPTELEHIGGVLLRVAAQLSAQAPVRGTPALDRIMTELRQRAGSTSR